MLEPWRAAPKLLVHEQGMEYGSTRVCDADEPRERGEAGEGEDAA